MVVVVMIIIIIIVPRLKELGHADSLQQTLALIQNLQFI
jgi:hypothetical protein